MGGVEHMISSANVNMTLPLPCAKVFHDIIPNLQVGDDWQQRCSTCQRWNLAASQFSPSLVCLLLQKPVVCSSGQSEKVMVRQTQECPTLGALSCMETNGSGPNGYAGRHRWTNSNAFCLGAKTSFLIMSLDKQMKIYIW